jgi:hypothetical protein
MLDEFAALRKTVSPWWKRKLKLNYYYAKTKAKAQKYSQH